jgi:hypothetical protein
LGCLKGTFRKVSDLFSSLEKGNLFVNPFIPLHREKVQHWLEKRGRSVASCRHLGCLGHQIKDFKVPERKSNSVKSIRTGRLDVTGTVEGSVCASPILLKVLTFKTITIYKQISLTYARIILTFLAQVFGDEHHF